ncbi:receptor-like kinase TMK4 [Panicum miliaceum]|uniref:Receptor-like kinase TMK4 n=1 Tax=Panicum miliaceum TaxID=4540 RepID=A0A3L6QEG5_PANMI|nr:receptor-like kinase TMK4 [Panicum miliaceum]
MASLRRLVLTGNAFTTVPYDFFHELTSPMISKMDNLRMGLWLIPNAIADCTRLQIFSASNISLTGALHVALTNLKSLTMLWLSYNYLRGNLPAWLAELSSLEIIGLDNHMSNVKLLEKIDIFALFKTLK